MARERVTATDKGWAWVVVTGVSVSFMILAGFVRGFGVFYASLVDEFGSSASVTSLIQGFRFVAVCISAPIASCLTERYTERAVLMTGSLIFSLALILSYFAPNLEFNVLTLGVMTGIGMASILTPGQIAVGKYFDKYRSLANSICFCGSSLGMMSLPPFVMYLINQYGLRGSLLIYGGLFLNCAVGAAVVRPFKGHNSLGTLVGTSDAEDGNKACAEDVSVTEVEDQPRVTPEDESETPDNMYQNAPRALPIAKNRYDVPNRSVTDNNSTVEEPYLRKREKDTLTDKENGPGTEDAFRTETPQNEVKYTEKNPLPTSEIELSNAQLYSSYASLHCIDGSMFLNVGKDVEIQSIGTSSGNSSTSGKKKCGFITSVIDFSLFRNVRYVLFLLSTSFAMVSFANVTIYLIPRAEEYGISRDKAALFLTIAGACDIIGRLILGVVSDIKKIGPHRVMMAGLFLMGIATLLLPLTDSFNTMTVYVVIFGLIGSAGHLLCLPIIVLFVGTHRMPRAMGLVMSFHGIASAVSPPILGYIKDTTGSYDSTFYVCGACQLLAGLLMAVEPLARRTGTMSKSRNADTADLTD